MSKFATHWRETIFATWAEDLANVRFALRHHLGTFDSAAALAYLADIGQLGPAITLDVIWEPATSKDEDGRQ